MSSMASSSALGGGKALAQAGSTITWQVAQVRLPPQSAAMPSMPALVAPCMMDWPILVLKLPVAPCLIARAAIKLIVMDVAIEQWLIPAEILAALPVGFVHGGIKAADFLLLDLRKITHKRATKSTAHRVVGLQCLQGISQRAG
jgi:hypothetical protein